MRTVHHYSDAEKARAIGRALVVGPLRASKELSIPEATIASWRRKFPNGLDEFAVSREAVTAELWSTFTDSVERIKGMIHDPKVRLGDVVKAADSLRDSHALLTGGATSRVESQSLNVNVSQVESTLDAMDPAAYHAMLAAMAEYTGENVVDHLVEALRRLSPEQAAELEARLAEAEKPLTWDETPSEHGIYGMLPNGAEMYFSPDDERWQTGELVRRFDPRRGPSGKRLTDGP